MGQQGSIAYKAPLHLMAANAWPARGSFEWVNPPGWHHERPSQAMSPRPNHVPVAQCAAVGETQPARGSGTASLLAFAWRASVLACRDAVLADEV